MIPIVIGLGLVSALAVGRAAWRAKVRLDKLPASYFGVIDVRGPDSKAPFLMGGFLRTMTYSEALQILGLPQNPSKKQVSEHHRRIMMANHPDHGGSTYMATKVNQARNVVKDHTG